MTWQVLVTVFTLGGLGAMVRGGIIMILASSAKIFPMSILLVNMLAAFLGGFILSLQLPADLGAALSIGLVGGIGTLSSIHGNLLDLFFDKAYRRLALYLGITIFGGVLIAQAGLSTGKFLIDMTRGPQDLQTEMLLNSLHQQEANLEQLQQRSHSELLDAYSKHQLKTDTETETKTDSNDQSFTKTDSNDQSLDESQPELQKNTDKVDESIRHNENHRQPQSEDSLSNEKLNQDLGKSLSEGENLSYTTVSGLCADKDFATLTTNTESTNVALNQVINYQATTLSIKSKYLRSKALNNECSNLSLCYNSFACYSASLKHGA